MKIELTLKEIELLSRLDDPSEGQRAIEGAMVRAIAVGTESEGGDRA